MYLYRYNLDEKEIYKFAHDLHAHYLRDKSTFVKSLKNLEIHKMNIYDGRGGSGMTYFVVNPSKAIKSNPMKRACGESEAICGFVSLNNMKRWKSKEIHITYIMPQYRRKNLAYKLYRAVVNDGIILVSGTMQNPKSKNLWLKLSKSPNTVMWAHDILNTKRYAPIHSYDGELLCDLKIYSDIKMMRKKKKEDVRFVICQKPAQFA